MKLPEKLSVSHESIGKQWQGLGCMYAIIEFGGKQYRVQEGDTLLLDLQNWKEGQEVAFENVLLVSGEEGVQVGAPKLDGMKVCGQVLGIEKGKKIVVFKFRRRKGTKRKRGHRQKYQKVFIKKIET